MARRKVLNARTPEPVQYVPGDPGRADDHGGRCQVRSVELQQKIAAIYQIASLGAQIEAEQTRAEQIEEFAR